MFLFSAEKRWKNRLKLEKLELGLTEVKVGNEIDGVRLLVEPVERTTVAAVIDHEAEGIESVKGIGYVNDPEAAKEVVIEIENGNAIVPLVELIMVRMFAQELDRGL